MGNAAETRGAGVQAGILDQLVAEIAARGGLPAAARVVQRLHETVRKDDCAVPDVVRVILGDTGLASKVLQVVNSAFYRPRGEPISTVTRAILVLGFEAMRDLTAGIALLDELVRTAGPGSGVKEELRRALLCGLVARDLSAKVGYSTPEEAYLLGLFAHCGTLCLAAYRPEDFAHARHLAETRGVALEDAAAEVVGVRPSDLATTVLERWSFPPRYTDYFRWTPPPDGVTVHTPAAKLQAVVSLAAACTVEGVDNLPEAAARLRHRYESMFNRKGDELVAATASAAQALAEQAPILGLGTVTPRRRPPGATAAAATLAHPPEAAPPSAPLDGTVFRILSEVTRAITEQSRIHDTLSMVLEGIVRAGAFDVALFALLTPRRDALVARLGFGTGVEECLAAVHVPLVPGGGALADAALARVPRLIEKGAPAMLVAPGAPAPRIEIGALAFYPVEARGRVVGVLVAMRKPGPPPTPGDLELAQLFANQAALALDRASA